MDYLLDRKSNVPPTKNHHVRLRERSKGSYGEVRAVNNSSSRRDREGEDLKKSVDYWWPLVCKSTHTHTHTKDRSGRENWRAVLRACWNVIRKMQGTFVRDFVGLEAASSCEHICEIKSYRLGDKCGYDFTPDAFRWSQMSDWAVGSRS